MKKTTLKTIAIALVMTLMLAMTACGGNKDAALEKYFQTDEMQEMVQEAKDSVEGSGMSIEILAEGNTLIYEYTFEEDSFDDSMLDAVKEQLVSGLESTASTFEEIASDLNDELKVENSKVVVRYLYNGETLAESEYTAD
jgi:hypothetical protein